MLKFLLQRILNVQRPCIFILYTSLCHRGIYYSFICLRHKKLHSIFYTGQRYWKGCIHSYKHNVIRRFFLLEINLLNCLLACVYCTLVSLQVSWCTECASLACLSCLRTTGLWWLSAWGLLRIWMKSPRTCWMLFKRTWSWGIPTRWEMTLWLLLNTYQLVDLFILLYGVFRGKNNFCLCSSLSLCLEKEQIVTWHPCQSRAWAAWTWAMLVQTTWLIMGWAQTRTRWDLKQNVVLRVHVSTVNWRLLYAR